MKHVEWIDPDNIILVNTTSFIYDEFVSDMRSKKYTNLRIVSHELETLDTHVTSSINLEYGTPGLSIRYVIENRPKWYSCNILQRKGDDCYIEITRYLSAEYDIDSSLENLYKIFDRENKLNQLFK